MRDFPSAETLPRWVPEGARRYLLHTENGRSIRDLARDAGCHASTVLRQIRRIETRRDDPLVDAALAALAATFFIQACAARGRPVPNSRGLPQMNVNVSNSSEFPNTSVLNLEAVRVLRRLCETGAVLAVAENMEKAVVVRDGESGTSTRTAVVDAAVAQAMALKDWITCPNPGRISRYYISASGRSALGRLLAEQENHQRAAHEGGFSESQRGFSGSEKSWSQNDIDDSGADRSRRMRYSVAESPLIALARRKDRDGAPFLSNAHVNAGERLREDFELAQMGPRTTQNWDSFLSGGARGGYYPDSGVPNGPAAARARVARALGDLGPGLSDVALRCCCYLEGLETAEKKLGWSARSGKIVLRIALHRLIRHYDEQSAPDRMIG